MNEQEETKKSFSISELAHMNTLSGEEAEEAAEQAESIEESGEDVAVSYEAVPEEEKKPVELEHYGQTFTVDVKPTARDTYAVLVGIAAIVMVVISVMDKEIFQIVLFSIAALIFIVNSPISLYLRAKKYAESCKLPENRTIYRFSDAGFDVRRGVMDDSEEASPSVMRDARDSTSTSPRTRLSLSRRLISKEGLLPSSEASSHSALRESFLSNMTRSREPDGSYKEA